MSNQGKTPKYNTETTSFAIGRVLVYAVLGYLLVTAITAYWQYHKASIDGQEAIVNVVSTLKFSIIPFVVGLNLIWRNRLASAPSTGVACPKCGGANIARDSNCRYCKAELPTVKID